VRWWAGISKTSDVPYGRIILLMLHLVFPVLKFSLPLAAKANTSSSCDTALALNFRASTKL
ncbi:hypothetical protein MKX01_031001, partial [Papaver californicum]